MIYNINHIKAFSTEKSETAPFPVILPHQTHSNIIRTIESTNINENDLDGVDGLITNIANLGIAVKTADCVPVLLFDTKSNTIAAIHCGWRGTVGHISQNAIQLMNKIYNSHSDNIHAIIGPSISMANFQVGDEVVDAFAAAGFPMNRIHRNEGPKIAGTMQGGHHIDLWQANSWLLEEMGVLTKNIHICGVCTYANHNKYYSARHDGISTGRIINGIKLDI